MALPIFKDPNTNLMLMQSNWASQLNPVLGNPLTSPSIIKGVALKVGNNVINHLLGRTQQGWFITDINGAAQIYRNAPFNDLTLTLNSSAVVTVNIAVF